MNPEDIILRYYSKKEDITSGLPDVRFDASVSPCMIPHGLGDCVILTDIAKVTRGAISPYCGSRHFQPLMAKVPGIGPVRHRPVLVDVPSAYHSWNLGPGHLVQRVRRMFGQPVDRVPVGGVVSSEKRVPGRVVIHCEAGLHSGWQRENIHPRAREIYPENMEVIRAFAESRSDLEWTAVGNNGPAWARRVNPPDAGALVDYMATCEWFIGIISGPMHVATAVGVKCIVIVNFPDPRKIILPTMKVLGTVEEEWFYPQNVHLHQEGSGPLVPRFSMASLERSFGGEVYPFWTTNWCGMAER